MRTLTEAPNWPALAHGDLLAMRHTLRDSSPAPLVERAGADFRAWLDEGLRACLPLAPRVQDDRGHYWLLARYAAGFRDSHVQTWPTDRLGPDPRRPLAWSGFAVGLHSDGYRVVLASPDLGNAPPLGARLEGCDGQGVAEMVAARDLWDGNMQLGSARLRAAPLLLLDRGNPFLPRPAVARFGTAAGTHDYQLDWRAIGVDEAAAVRRAALGQVPRRLGLAIWGERDWWLTVPGMEDGQDWAGFLAAVATNLAAIRRAPLVVVDLRGNGGGSSAHGDRLARLLWGEAFVDAHRPDLGPTLWRASRLNRDDWQRFVDRLAADPGLPANELAGARMVLARYDAALAEGAASFTLGEDGGPRPAAGDSPMAGRVVLLTDHACASACLDLMDLFTAMPGTVQAGGATDADTIFMDLATVEALPSGLVGLGWGRKAWVGRPRGSNRPYVPAPALTWHGSPDDEAGLRRWLRNTMGHFGR